jgi:signal peptidase II
MLEDNKSKAKVFILSALTFAILYALDRLSKYMAVVKLKGNEPVKFFGDSFELFYLENQGAAWGILSGKIWLLIIFTAIVLCLLLFFYYRIPNDKHFLMLRIALLLIISGALGNIIDRIRFKYVIDFLYAKFIDFPVFNVADCYVTVGTFMLIIGLLFVYKDSELGFWFLDSKSEE